MGIVMEINKAFGEVLKQKRVHNSISQEELAYLSNLDRTFISMLERGKRQPSLKTIFVLADALETLPSQLISEVEKKLKL